ncbi:hypothetical protein RclHR1_05620005 [Rhizophagus clarus]|uniref:Ubiquitin ligase complex F-box protein GRR1, putative n=1 Tax=Rhizophagus clarus TaxID=94130 RepID=A0A2Z6RPZ8_9GLOM|nr:hypothetical protein RclHR1_05620005 [Rhizophagus clarus]GES96201.1 ubiquitin ligase complex F-box protein GRR1, putative [Rhizophagus clarus]
MHIYNPLSNHYILVQVFGFLINQRDIYNCTLVNTQWNISATPFLYRAPKLNFSNINILRFLQTIKNAKEKQTSQPYNEMVREWSLKDSNSANYIAECCPNIEKLSCNNESFILCDNNNNNNVNSDDFKTKTVLNNWINLKSITLYNRCGTDLILEAIKINCSRLEELILWNCSVTDIGLIEIFKTCKILKSLRLYQCHEITDQTLISMSEICNSLINLDLRDCKKLSDNGILALSNSKIAKNLLSLYLEALNIKEDSFLVLAENTTNLRELYLRRLETITDEIVTAFAIGSRPCLKRLHLHLCPRFIGWGVKEAIEIRELSLLMQNIKLQVINIICENCRFLERFTLDIVSYSFSYSNEEIIGALSQLKNLKSLALFCGIKFSKFEVYEIKRRCKELVQINC